MPIIYHFQPGHGRTLALSDGAAKAVTPTPPCLPALTGCRACLQTTLPCAARVLSFLAFIAPEKTKYPPTFVGACLQTTVPCAAGVLSFLAFLAPEKTKKAPTFVGACLQTTVPCAARVLGCLAFLVTEKKRKKPKHLSGHACRPLCRVLQESRIFLSSLPQKTKNIQTPSTVSVCRSRRQRSAG